jgi:uncharacterized protein (TIGR02246 family)
MRRFACAVALLCMGTLGAAGIAQAKPASAEDEVVAAEQAREDALTHNDFAALDKLMADDAFYCHAAGRVDNKAAFLDTLRSGRNRYVKIERSDTKVRVDGKMALITASLALTTQPAGQAEPRPVENVVATIVFEKRDGRWQMIWAQSTRKPAPAGAEAAPGAPPAR